MNRKIETVQADLEKACSHAISHWLAVVALLVIAAVYWPISKGLVPIPRWVLSGVVVVGVASMLLARLRGRHVFGRNLGLGLIAAITLAETTSTLLLVALLPRPDVVPATHLLRDAAVIWASTW